MRLIQAWGLKVGCVVCGISFIISTNHNSIAVKSLRQRVVMQYIDDYFTQQAKEFALNGEQISKNRFEILRKLSFIPLMDGNLPLFQQFINQLSETDFLDRSHVNHIYRYGLFMLENKDLAGAGRLFEYSQKREPDNALPINGLGLVAKARGERQAAKTLFQQAVEMAEMNDDYRISEYKQNLEQLD